MTEASNENSLYHFSEDPTIERFEPRSVKTSVIRPEGFEWLNGPLVWAIDEQNSPLYLFPRECPRILIGKHPTSTEEDISKYWKDTSKPLIAFIEEGWVNRLKNTRLFRYRFENNGFIDLEDSGMHVKNSTVIPEEMVEIGDLFSALKRVNVEVQILPDLTSLQNAWDSSLNVSGIRLRNALNWNRELFWLRP